MNVKDYNHNATFCMTWNKDCAKSIIDVFEMTQSKGDLQENLEIYLLQSLLDYYNIDKKRPIVRLSIKVGMKFQDLLNMKDALDDTGHPDYIQYNDLEECLEMFDNEEDAINEVKDNILIMEKKNRAGKRKKKPVDK